MKKQILACAVATTFAMGAVAADVTLYGSIDIGLLYHHFNGENSSTSSLVMDKRNWNPGSYWGIKGAEELGNGYSVSFELESGFNPDDGTLNSSKRFFSRESRLTVAGPFGELSFGSMSSLTSSIGTYSIFGRNALLNHGGWTTLIGSCYTFYSPIANNMITYATPSVSGFRGYAQYSFQVDGSDKKGTEGKNSTERYAAVGLTYENGPLAAVAIFSDNLMPKRYSVANRDSHIISLGGSYDFDAAKVFAAYQYGTNQTYAGGYTTSNLVINFPDGSAPFGNTLVKAHNFHVGVAVPLFSGEAGFGAYYTRAKSVSDYANRIKSYNVLATYTYPLSKRTHIYAGAGYAESRFKSITSKIKEKAFEMTAGLHHDF